MSNWTDMVLTRRSTARSCRRVRVLLPVAILAAVLCFVAQLSRWSGAGTEAATLPARLRPLRGAARPNTSALPHLVGWRRPSDAAAPSWRVERALAGDVAPCHGPVRDYEAEPVRLRDTAGYSMTRVVAAGSTVGAGSTGAASRQDLVDEVQCAIPCVRIAGGLEFGEVALAVVVVAGSLAGAGVMLRLRFSARAGAGGGDRDKPGDLPRLSRLNPSMRKGRSQRRGDAANAGDAGAALWLPPLLLLGGGAMFAGQTLLTHWHDRADASPGSTLGLLSDGCGWRWTSTMENMGDTAAQMLALSSPTIVSSTLLASDVPVPYAEPSLLTEVYGPSATAAITGSFESRSTGWERADTAAEIGSGEGLVAAFISNCGPGEAQRERLRWVQGLIDAGIAVDSYGRCLHNRKEKPDSDLGATGSKVNLLRRYKFAIAFENSPREDYTTEKFTQALLAGAIPVTLGPPNLLAGGFAPHPDSFLAAESFASPTELAVKLLAVGNDRHQWVKMAARWREIPLTGEAGHSDPQDHVGPGVFYRQFAAMVGLNAVHSDCRRCIWIADAHRLRRTLAISGQSDSSTQNRETEANPEKDCEPVGGLFALQDAHLGTSSGSFSRKRRWVAVRERGAYRFVRVAVPTDDSMTSVEQLMHNAIAGKSLDFLLKCSDFVLKMFAFVLKMLNFAALKAHPKGCTAHGNVDSAIPAAIYTLWGREVVDSTSAVEALACGTELELVMVLDPKALF